MRWLELAAVVVVVVSKERKLNRSFPRKKTVEDEGGNKIYPRAVDQNGVRLTQIFVVVCEGVGRRRAHQQ